MRSQTFTPSSLLDNDSVTLLDIWEHHEKHSSDHPLFQFNSGEANDTGSVITWGEAIRAMQAAGRIVLDALVKDGVFDPSEGNGVRPVIGILAVTDMITAWATVAGIIWSGFTVLLLSPRNSTPALAHLLKSTRCRMLIHSTDKFVETVLADTLALLRESGEEPMSLCHLPEYSKTYGRQEDVQLLPRHSNVHPDDTALISHTSGTTSFPKPRMISHKTILQAGKCLYMQNLDMSDKVLSVHSLPHFHMMGTVTTLGWATVSGMTMGVFPPIVPPTVPTPQRVLDAAFASRAEAVFGVPSFCESWAADEEAVKKLASINHVIYSGGPLNRRVGDFLVGKGVKVHPLYGLTETGGITAYPLDIPSKDWEYFKINKYVNAHYVREEGTSDVYELILTESPGLRPCIFNTTFGGRPALATGDLLARHPTNSDLWRVAGRKDDQIMHTNGEKTNPGPIESIIVKHPAVGRVLMFGKDQFHPGLLIEPSKALKDEEARNAFIDEIWPNVEEANAHAPTHSRIFREMIVLASPEKPLKVTPKQTLRRSEILADYADEIAEAYLNFQQSTSSSTATTCTPISWKEADCASFIQQAVTSILGRSLEKDDDFFQNGFNSLEALYLRSTIARAIHQADANISFETSSIYNFPTAASLGKFISDLVSGNVVAPETIDRRARQISALVDRFTAQFPNHVGTSPLSGEEVILVTGTTGSLGINVLKNLVSLEAVQKVYAFNRKSPPGGNFRDRHLQATQLQGLDESWLDSPKIIYLEGDITLATMGLPEDTVREMRSTLTGIIHLAWKVDFNMSLNSFIPQLQGVRHLIDLALSSDLEKVPSLVFASSISDLQNLSEGGLIPATVNPDPRTAIGMGYGESKWVASRILETARGRTPLRPVIVRIGQLCANSETGRWNPWEWFPTIVRSAKATGCIPELEAELSWIPVDTAASTIVDVRQVGDSASVVNLVHPHPVDSKTVVNPIALSLNLPVESYTKWLERLKGIKDTTVADGEKVLEEVPALRLFDFYQSLASDEPAGRKKAGDSMQLRLAIDQTVKLSKTLSSDDLRPLGESDVIRWLKYWSVSA